MTVSFTTEAKKINLNDETPKTTEKKTKTAQFWSRLKESENLTFQELRTIYYIKEQSSSISFNLLKKLI